MNLFIMTKKSFLPFVACLALVVLMGAGCRGSSRSEEPTPAFPFGEEAPTEPSREEAPSAMSACGNEYYPLHVGYNVEYRTQGGSISRPYNSRLTVNLATERDVTVLNSIDRQEGPPLELTIQYKCEAGALKAVGYVDATSVTAAEGTVGRGASIETTSAEGEFMPARISNGQTWSAKYSIKLTPLDRPDVLQERAAAVTTDVTIIRTAMGEETITVPAGRFKAMKIASNTSFNGALAHTGYEWWVKGKGMVKSVQGAGSGAITTEALQIRTGR